jgi:hypothetical protein
MQEAVLSPLATWQNFYVIIGSAAATLTGLMFVVITLIAGVRERVSLPSGGIAAFNTPNVFHFGAALWNASLLLGLFGLGAMTYIVIVVQRVPRALRQTAYQPVLEDWLWHTVFPLVSYTALVVTAMVLPGNPALALFVIGGAQVLLLFIGIHNAWDNVTYLVLELSQSENKRRDQ